MPIRPARHSDIPIMAQVLGASFGPDRLFQVMFPHQDQYPEDLVTAFRRSLRRAWWDYSKILMVSYETPSSDPTNDETRAITTTRNGQKEVITGMIEWQRVGLGWEHVWNLRGWWDPRRLIQKFIHWRNRIAYALRPCRASARPTETDPDPLVYTNFVARSMPFSMHLLVFPSKPWRENHWSLEVLGIHPSYQGKGYGKQLAQWGLARAKCDTASGVTGLPSVVMAANGKEGFYQKVGFNELVGWSGSTPEGMEGLGRNPLGERGCGGAVLWSWSREDEEEARRQVEAKEAGEGGV
ncbi:hypothetical protein PMZ80_004165 [Knufia obscura]|uniref:N-acetyltransferase domain-containing protein n=2 Tax=Knufia TaxID=430999 RepID=A0AAN8I2H5_9EURO|nr:hypothetical protein PMZ80_004165 [Knufia obscura]KAK5948709.1 hypothetical protein OHC33_010312 [Knufia fluminis]